MGKTAQVTVSRDPTGVLPPDKHLVDVGTPLHEFMRAADVSELGTAKYVNDTPVTSDYVIVEGDKVRLHEMPADPVTFMAIGVFFTQNAIGVAIAQAAISLAVSMILNALFKPKKPTIDSTTASPVYSINGIENSARLNEIVQVGYGTFIITAPYASQPYIRYESDQQYLYTLHCVGLGDYDIERVYLADTEENELAGDALEYEVYRPGDYTKMVQVGSKWIPRGKFGRIEAQSAMRIRENVYTSPNVVDKEMFKPVTDDNTLVTSFHATVRYDVPDTLTIYRPPDHIRGKLSEFKYYNLSVYGRHTNLPNPGLWENTLEVLGQPWQQNIKFVIPSGVTWKTNNVGLNVNGNWEFIADGDDQIIDYRRNGLGVKDLYAGDAVRIRNSTFVVKQVYSTVNILRLRLSAINPTYTVRDDPGVFWSGQLQRIGERINVELYGAGQSLPTPFYPAWRDTLLPKAVELDFIMPGGAYTNPDSGGIAGLDVYYTVTIQDDDTKAVIWERQFRNKSGASGAGSANVVPFRTKDTQRWTLFINQNQKDDSGRYLPPTGKWNVAVERHDNVEEAGNPVDAMSWSGLKGIGSGLGADGTPYAPDVYQQSTLVACRIKATEGVSAAAQSRIRMKATRMLQPYSVNTPPSPDPSTPHVRFGPTGNPVDAYTDILTSTYGGGMALANLHRPSLDDLLNITTKHTLEFNAVFDQATTVTEALKASVAAVPATPTPHQYLLGVTRIKQIPFDQYLYTDYHAIEGSIQRGYLFRSENDVDGVEVEYRDPERFTPQIVSAGSVLSTDVVERVTLFGCTDVVQAQEFANYYWQRVRWQRKTMTFSTSGMGHVPNFGDRIRCHFQEINTGFSYQCVDISTSATQTGTQWRVKLDKDPPNGMTKMMGRNQLGAPSALITVKRTLDTSDGRYWYDVSGTVTSAAVSKPKAFDTVYAFTTGSMPGDSWLITGIRPAGGGPETRIEMEGVVYKDQVYLMRGQDE